MSAVDVLETPRLKSGRKASVPETSDFAWRVLILLNLFRLTLGLLLLVVFYLHATSFGSLGRFDQSGAFVGRGRQRLLHHAVETRGE